MTIPLFHIGPPPPDEDAAAKAVDAALAEVTQTMSPAAQTILDAITLKRYDAPHYACPQDLDQIRSDAAAAMRAVADQVANPDDYEPMCVFEKDYWDAGFSAGVATVRKAILLVAAELEARADG